MLFQLSNKKNPKQTTRSDHHFNKFPNGVSPCLKVNATYFNIVFGHRPTSSFWFHDQLGLTAYKLTQNSVA